MPHKKPKEVQLSTYSHHTGCLVVSQPPTLVSKKKQPTNLIQSKAGDNLQIIQVSCVSGSFTYSLQLLATALKFSGRKFDSVDENLPDL